MTRMIHTSEVTAAVDADAGRQDADTRVPRSAHDARREQVLAEAGMSPGRLRPEAAHPRLRRLQGDDERVSRLLHVVRLPLRIGDTEQELGAPHHVTSRVLRHRRHARGVRHISLYRRLSKRHSEVSRQLQMPSVSTQLDSGRGTCDVIRHVSFHRRSSPRVTDT